MTISDLALILVAIVGVVNYFQGRKSSDATIISTLQGTIANALKLQSDTIIEVSDLRNKLSLALQALQWMITLTPIIQDHLHQHKRSS